MPTHTPYPAYRNTDLPWLAQIPAHWDVKRLKYVAIVNPSKTEISYLPKNLEVSFLPMELVGEGTLTTDKTKTIEAVGQGFTYFRDGDVVVAKITPSFENGKGSIADGLVNGIGFGTTELHVIRPSRKIDKRFLYYLTISYDFREIGTGMMQGTAGQKRVPDSFLIDYPVAFPPIPEQRTIAAYLDRQTAKIDALIAKKQRLLELLAEQRAALISRAVTKGLNPDVEMKDSGVAWLGQVPEHWEVNKIKYVAQLESGHTPRKSIPEYWENCTIPWVSLNDVGYIREHEFISETVNLISELGLAHSSARMLPKGTVILSRDASVGFCAILSQPMATSQHFVNWICSRKLFNEYLLLALKWAMQQELKKLTMGSTVLTIGLPDVKSFTIPVPPIDEQEKIVLYVKTKKRYLDSIIAKTEKMIGHLHEYRAALISSAVTGKIMISPSR